MAAARCVAGDAETLSYYLNCWQSLFSVQDAAGAVRLFRTEFFTVAGALTAVLFLGFFRPGAAAHLPFYDAVWDRLRIAFVQAACGFEPTDNICAALRLRYPRIPCGRNVVYVRRIRTADKRKAFVQPPSGAEDRLLAQARFLGQFARMLFLLLPLCGAAVGMLYLAGQAKLI